jgi:hypothetical protein
MAGEREQAEPRGRRPTQDKATRRLGASIPPKVRESRILGSSIETTFFEHRASSSKLANDKKFINVSLPLHQAVVF